jgi:hypothetical protein
MLKSAQYNPATNQVALTPKKPFALTKPVQAPVNGTGKTALFDSDGRSINWETMPRPCSAATERRSRRPPLVPPTVASQSSRPSSMSCWSRMTRTRLSRNQPRNPKSQIRKDERTMRRCREVKIYRLVALRARQALETSNDGSLTNGTEITTASHVGNL